MNQNGVIKRRRELETEGRDEFKIPNLGRLEQISGSRSLAKNRRIRGCGGDSKIANRKGGSVVHGSLSGCIHNRLL